MLMCTSWFRVIFFYICDSCSQTTTTCSATTTLILAHSSITRNYSSRPAYQSPVANKATTVPLHGLTTPRNITAWVHHLTCSSPHGFTNSWVHYPTGSPPHRFTTPLVHHLMGSPPQYHPPVSVW